MSHTKFLLKTKKGLERRRSLAWRHLVQITVAFTRKKKKTSHVRFYISFALTTTTDVDLKKKKFTTFCKPTFFEPQAYSIYLLNIIKNYIISSKNY